MKFVIAILTCFTYLVSFAQTLPDQITFHYLQSKTTIGTNHTDNPRTPTCIRFTKNNNDILGISCVDESKIVVFSISGVQSEKRDQETYTITFFGYQYYAVGPVYSFLTYGYNFRTSRWNIMLENVADNSSDGTIRIFVNYFNMN